eukprot:GHVU01181113.1.p1 GENE.GHVU01181113.1~~GHVU01181113.1.p1  ORF type:complete len:326 (-),score=65.16 GHVU01181113.1:252-1229(-)
MASNFKTFQELYALSHGPFKSDSLLEDLEDLDESDWTVENLLNEVSYLKQFMSEGLTRFEEFVTSQNGMPQNQSCGMHLLVPFLARGQTIQKRIASLANNAASLAKCSPAEEFRLAESIAKGKGAALDTPIPDLIDTTAGKKWEPAPEFSKEKGKVVFKNHAQVVQGDVEVEEPLKVESKRNTRRHLTGYSKFNMKDIHDLLDSDENSTTLQASQQGDSDDQREGIEGLQRQDSAGLDGHLRFTVEDEKTPEAKEWEERDRHQKRESRIRNRVPTGHPTILNSAVDELRNEYEAGMMDEDADQSDDELKENTEKNKMPIFRSDGP